MAPLWRLMSSYWKTILSLTIWPNMKAKGQKSRFLNFSVNCRNLEMQSRLFKYSNFLSLLWIGKNLEIYTVPDQHFKIPMLNLLLSWENLCLDLSFAVENKMENSYKRGWQHFKPKITDWEIPFPKIWRIYKWIGKNIFHWGIQLKYRS